MRNRQGTERKYLVKLSGAAKEDRNLRRKQRQKKERERERE